MSLMPSAPIPPLDETPPQLRASRYSSRASCPARRAPPPRLPTSLTRRQVRGQTPKRGEPRCSKLFSRLVSAVPATVRLSVAASTDATVQHISLSSTSVFRVWIDVRDGIPPFPPAATSAATPQDPAQREAGRPDEDDDADNQRHE